jgi:hypothetical protein
MMEKIKIIVEQELDKAAIYRELAKEHDVDIPPILLGLKKVLKEQKAFSTGDYIIDVATACYIMGREEQMLELLTALVGEEELARIINQATKKLESESQTIN